MTVQDLLGSGFVTVQNLSNTEDYVTDGNVTNGGPSPCDDESGLLYFVILVLVINSFHRSGGRFTGLGWRFTGLVL